MIEIKKLSGKKITHVAVGFKSCVVVTNEENGFYVWGENKHGQLGLESSTFEPTVNDFFDGHEIIQVACGSIHTLVWTSKGLFGFGNNEDGQLGLKYEREDKRNRILTPVAIPFFESKKIIEIFATGWHSIVITTVGIYGFGRNENGEFWPEETLTQPTFLSQIAKSDFDQWSFVPKQNHPELLLPLLLSREFDTNSVFYKDRFPLDLFKIIVQTAELGKIPKDYSSENRVN